MLVLLNDLLVVEVKKCFPVFMFCDLFLGNIETYLPKIQDLGQRLQKIAPAINLFIQISSIYKWYSHNTGGGH